MYLNQFYVSNKTEYFSYKGVCGIHGYTVLRQLKEELTRATDKWLQIISNIMLFKTAMPLGIKEQNHFKFKKYNCICYYVVLSKIIYMSVRF